MNSHFNDIKCGKRIFHIEHGYGIVTNTNLMGCLDPYSDRVFVVYFDNNLVGPDGNPVPLNIRVSKYDCNLYKVI